MSGGSRAGWGGIRGGKRKAKSGKWKMGTEPEGENESIERRRKRVESLIRGSREAGGDRQSVMGNRGGLG